jgi:hypothetical protein
VGSSEVGFKMIEKEVEEVLGWISGQYELWLKACAET